MSRTVVLIIVATVVVLFGSMFTRLALAHSDASALANYVTSILPPLVPAVGAWYTSHRARRSADQASVSADEAKELTGEVATNTNGKLDIRFAKLTGMVQVIESKLDRHLEMHELGDK